VSDAWLSSWETLVSMRGRVSLLIYYCDVIGDRNHELVGHPPSAPESLGLGPFGIVVRDFFQH
jgi:hypothetical protein